MKFLRDRKEIAKAINIDRIPVITFDLDNPGIDFEHSYKGSRINIDGAHGGKYANLLTHCTAYMYSDEPGNGCYFTPWAYKTISLSPRTSGLTASFSSHDVDEMIEWSHAPTVKANDTVVVCFKKGDDRYLRLMKIGARIDPFCTTATTLVDVDEE